LVPTIGYNPNASKSWLVVKREHVQQAIEIFQGTNVNVPSEGRKHLSAAIGSVEHKENHVNGLVQKCKKENFPLLH